MEGFTRCRNADLDPTSGADMTLLPSAFKAGVHSLSDVIINNDNHGYVLLETVDSYTEPEPNIAAMLAVIESLSKGTPVRLERVLAKNFDIGYDCGLEPWGFTQRLSPQRLGRISAAGASLMITIYPDLEQAKQ